MVIVGGKIVDGCKIFCEFRIRIKLFNGVKENYILEEGFYDY